MPTYRINAQGAQHRRKEPGTGWRTYGKGDQIVLSAQQYAGPNYSHLQLSHVSDSDRVTAPMSDVKLDVNPPVRPAIQNGGRTPDGNQVIPENENFGGLGSSATDANIDPNLNAGGAHNDGGAPGPVVDGSASTGDGTQTQEQVNENGSENQPSPNAEAIARLDGLITQVEETDSAGSFKAARDEVIAANVLTEVPAKKAETIQALIQARDALQGAPAPTVD